MLFRSRICSRLIRIIIMSLKFLQNSTVSELDQDWKFPRTARGFMAHTGENATSTVLRCVTNTKIPCTAKEAMAMGDKLKFSVTVLEIPQVGFAYAPYKRATGNKKIPKDPNLNARPLFEFVKEPLQSGDCDSVCDSETIVCL